MVGRFVEKQQLRFTKENLSEFHAHLPSVAELLHRTLHVVVFETETDENLLSLTLDRMTAHKHETFVEMTHLLAKTLI